MIPKKDTRLAAEAAAELLDRRRGPYMTLEYEVVKPVWKDGSVTAVPTGQVFRREGHAGAMGPLVEVSPEASE